MYMNNSGSDFIYSLIFAGIIVGIIIFVVVKITQANSEYDKNEKQSTIKNEPEQQVTQQQVSSQPTFERLPYYLQNSVFTFHESILFEILDEFCKKNNLVLLSKIRIADFVQPVERRNYHWLNRITSKHVDFLICQPKSYKPLLAIELDDYTHNYNNRRERDDFINHVYYSVGLPILHITEIRQRYIEKNVAEILGIKINTDSDIQTI